MKKNDVYEVEIIDVTYQGFGLAKVDGLSVFVENTLKGELVEIKIVKVLKKFAFGIVTKMIKESDKRVPLKDKVGMRIGTMPLQHMAYDEQLRFKKDTVVDVFSKLMSLDDVEVFDVIGMDHPWEYRNKAQVPVKMIDGQLESGFYKSGSHDLVPVTNFYIQDPKIDEAIVIIRDILRTFEIPAYDEVSHEGLIRNIGVRRSKARNEMMVILVFTKKEFDYKEELFEAIWNALDGIVSLVLNVNPKPTNVIMGRKNFVMKGENYYQDELMGHTFRISPFSFFQINPVQTEKLYQAAIDLADIGENDHVVDAYCGIGTISLSLAQSAAHVYGMDIIGDAITMAKANALVNGVKNVTFEVGDAAQVIGEWKLRGLKIDALVVDPPRKGLDATFIELAVSFDPKRIVYVSCNPATQARDVAAFIEAGYELKLLQPVDMFPQTLHVENIALLVKK